MTKTGDNTRRLAHRVLATMLALLAPPAYACNVGAVPLFGCEAAKGRKFIELCAPAPLDAQTGYLRYRFGSLDANGGEQSVELEYPPKGARSLKTSTISCSERPRSCIYDLKCLVPCDPETPVGTACVK